MFILPSLNNSKNLINCSNHVENEFHFLNLARRPSCELHIKSIYLECLYLTV